MSRRRKKEVDKVNNLLERLHFSNSKLRSLWSSSSSFSCLLLLLLLLLLDVNFSSSCDLSQFKCNGGPCNRTYSGRIGNTYELSILRQPNGTSTPCTITFMAQGGNSGDIAQLSLPLQTRQVDPCKNEIKIIEGRSTSYCLTSQFESFSEQVNYYSETNSVSLEINSNLKLSYKFLVKEPNLKSGSLLQGTLCSVVYSNCLDDCLIQSLNYPGFYPTNNTCYYAIRDENNYNIKLSGSLNIGNSHGGGGDPGLPGESLRYNSECGDEYLSIFNGYSTRDNLLIRVCGSGTFENIYSSTNELLLEFYSSGNVDLVGVETSRRRMSGEAGQGSTLHGYSQGSKYHRPMGFSLIATSIPLLDEDHQYSQSDPLGGTPSGHQSCSTASVISSFSRRSGRISNPKFTLPANSTCLTQFQGRPNELIWLRFLKFFMLNNSFVQLIDSGSPSPGGGSFGVGTGTTAGPGALIVGATQLFNSTNVPLLCEFLLLSSRVKPCPHFYISSTPQLSLKYYNGPGSFLEPASFIIDYEFLRQDLNCNHVYDTRSSFYPPENILLYGISGKTDLNCKYTFLNNQKINVTLRQVYFGSKNCISRKSEATGKSICTILDPKDLTIQLIFSNMFELGNGSFVINSECYCSGDSIEFTSNYNVQLQLLITNMNGLHDSTIISYQGLFSTMNSDCVHARVFSSSQVIKSEACVNYYVLEPRPYVYLRIRNLLGYYDTCSRVIIHSHLQMLHLCVEKTFEYVSPGFEYINYTQAKYNQVILETGIGGASIEFTYLQIFHPNESVFNYVNNERDTCGSYKCSSLNNACIESHLFCDGVSHCPKGEDEEPCQILNYNYILLGIFLTLLLVLFIYICCCNNWFDKRKAGLG